MKKRIIYLGMVGLALCAVHARAALTINVGDTITETEASPFLQSGAETGFVNGGTVGSSFEDVYAGSFNVNLTDNKNESSGTILTFCTDVGAEWNSGTVTYTATTFGSVLGVSPKWSTSPAAIQNAAWIYVNDFLDQGSLNVEQAAAVQLAIWKVLYDTEADGTMGSSLFTTGNFMANSFAGNTLSDATGLITAMEAARTADTFTSYTETWLDPTSAVSQGLLYDPSLGNDQVAVPEPATVLAGALLLLPLGASAYRIIRNRKTATV